MALHMARAKQHQQQQQNQWHSQLGHKPQGEPFTGHCGHEHLGLVASKTIDAELQLRAELDGMRTELLEAKAEISVLRLRLRNSVQGAIAGSVGVACASTDSDEIQDPLRCGGSLMCTKIMPKTTNE